VTLAKDTSTRFIQQIPAKGQPPSLKRMLQRSECRLDVMPQVPHSALPSDSPHFGPLRIASVPIVLFLAAVAFLFVFFFVRFFPQEENVAG
jgi:hypothetical protein